MTYLNPTYNPDSRLYPSPELAVEEKISPLEKPSLTELLTTSQQHTPMCDIKPLKKRKLQTTMRADLNLTTRELELREKIAYFGYVFQKKMVIIWSIILAML